jgi:hypothetical protein
LGGYIGFTIQRASGSDDERLVYPLTALGAGLGLGSSMLIAEEWDITIGDAWYLSAGMVWPGVSGLLLSQSYDVEPEKQYLWGLAGGSVGLTLATVSLTFDHMSQGGALMTHSGGVFGLFLGGVAQGIVDGSLDESPNRGMGYGAGVGVLAMGALATQIQTTPSRVLLVDLSASLGALTGAAVGSPLLFVDDESSATRNRVWLSAVALGTVVGAGLGWWLTPVDSAPDDAADATFHPVALPYAGVVGTSVNGDPVYGGGVIGDW